MTTSIRSGLTLLASAILLAGCASHVYSPFMNLPSQPLKKDRGQVIMGGSFLPETRPSIGGFASKGGEVMARYAFSDVLTLQARAWSRLEGITYSPVDGFSFEGMGMLNDESSSIRLAVVPRAVFMMSGQRIEGFGGFASLAAWFPELWGFRPYAAAGPGIAGFAIETSGDDANDRDNDGYVRGWGYGFISNVGAAYDLTPELTVNLEVANPVQVDRYSNELSTMILPSLAVAWTF